MESKVLTNTTTIPTGLLRLRKPVRGKSVTFTVVKPIARDVKVAGGGNLIWGRQLRPALLLEKSPVIKTSSVKRLAAASSSSPAEGSDGGVVKVGFLEKYPFLITGFFFFMCFVSVIHLAVGVVYCLVSWAVGLPKRAPMDSNQLKLLIPVAVCHALGHVTSNVSFAAVAVSFTHTIKSLEPFFNASASQFILGQQIPLSLWLSLAPVVIGVSMASLTELSFNWLGFISAMISNISFTYRSIYSKKAMTDMDSTNLYAYISIIALIVCIPPAIILEGPQLMKHGISDAIAKVGMTKFISDLFWVGMFYHLYNQVSQLLSLVRSTFLLLGSPVSVLLDPQIFVNIHKRGAEQANPKLCTGNKISTQTGIGTAIAIAGVAIYSYLKAKIEEEKRQKKAT
ncbi:hypothetical protein IFM89_023682 [Coptis chinensis]|uniref:Sugar phosphate transporter domain-containing protein n=1 Tax=Coptis chinensis TaxID=261450 RepID=A0A835LJA9_9MAGN|nr:hypothetical protein IFM89_023682 [Coptis chinensis]